MTFKCPSFFAAATSAVKPPPAEADVTFDQFAGAAVVAAPAPLDDELDPHAARERHRVPRLAPSTAFLINFPSQEYVLNQLSESDL